MTTVGIIGLGTAVPPHRASQRAFASFIVESLALPEDDARFVRLVSERSGIASRHAVILDRTELDGAALAPSLYDSESTSTGARMRAYVRHATPLAIDAARASFADAEGRVAPRDVTHLVTFSCTGMHAPGVDIELMRALELAPDVGRTHVGFMGCHAAINALRVAEAFVRADPSAIVLLVGVELSSLHLHPTSRRDQLVAACLFGDGAASVLVGSASPTDLRLEGTTSMVIEDTFDEMAWMVGDEGFEMTLSEAAPRSIARSVRHLVEHLPGVTTLERLRDEALWCVHPGGPRVLDEIASALELPPRSMDPARGVLVRHGNMSSVTTLFILDDVRRSEQVTPGQPIVAMAFGPGLTGEAAWFRQGDPAAS